MEGQWLPIGGHALDVVPGMVNCPHCWQMALRIVWLQLFTAHALGMSIVLAGGYDGDALVECPGTAHWFGMLQNQVHIHDRREPRSCIVMLEDPEESYDE
jgi:hypothetical protein